MSGDSSPALTHGWYSKEFPFWVFRLEVEARERAQARLEQRLAEHHAKR